MPVNSNEMIQKIEVALSTISTQKVNIANALKDDIKLPDYVKMATPGTTSISKLATDIAAIPTQLSASTNHVMSGEVFIGENGFSTGSIPTVTPALASTATAFSVDAGYLANAIDDISKVSSVAITAVEANVVAPQTFIGSDLKVHMGSISSESITKASTSTAFGFKPGFLAKGVADISDMTDATILGGDKTYFVRSGNFYFGSDRMIYEGQLATVSPNIVFGSGSFTLSNIEATNGNYVGPGSYPVAFSSLFAGITTTVATAEKYLPASNKVVVVDGAIATGVASYADLPAKPADGVHSFTLVGGTNAYYNKSAADITVNAAYLNYKDTTKSAVEATADKSAHTLTIAAFGYNDAAITLDALTAFNNTAVTKATTETAFSVSADGYFADGIDSITDITAETILEGSTVGEGKVLAGSKFIGNDLKIHTGNILTFSLSIGTSAHAVVVPDKRYIATGATINAAYLNYKAGDLAVTKGSASAAPVIKSGTYTYFDTEDSVTFSDLYNTADITAGTANVMKGFTYIDKTGVIQTGDLDTVSVTKASTSAALKLDSGFFASTISKIADITDATILAGSTVGEGLVLSGNNFLGDDLKIHTGNIPTFSLAIGTSTHTLVIPNKQYIATGATINAAYLNYKAGTQAVTKGTTATAPQINVGTYSYFDASSTVNFSDMYDLPGNYITQDDCVVADYDYIDSTGKLRVGKLTQLQQLDISDGTYQAQVTAAGGYHTRDDSVTTTVYPANLGLTKAENGHLTITPGVFTATVSMGNQLYTEEEIFTSDMGPETLGLTLLNELSTGTLSNWTLPVYAPAVYYTGQYDVTKNIAPSDLGLGLATNSDLTIKGGTETTVGTATVSLAASKWTNDIISKEVLPANLGLTKATNASLVVVEGQNTATVLLPKDNWTETAIASIVTPDKLKLESADLQVTQGSSDVAGSVTWPPHGYEADGTARRKGFTDMYSEEIAAGTWAVDTQVRSGKKFVDKNGKVVSGELQDAVVTKANATTAFSVTTGVLDNAISSVTDIADTAWGLTTANADKVRSSMSFLASDDLKIYSGTMAEVSNIIPATGNLTLENKFVTDSTTYPVVHTVDLSAGITSSVNTMFKPALTLSPLNAVPETIVRTADNHRVIRIPGNSVVAADLDIDLETIISEINSIEKDAVK